MPFARNFMWGAATTRIRSRAPGQRTDASIWDVCRQGGDHVYAPGDHPHQRRSAGLSADLREKDGTFFAESEQPHRPFLLGEQSVTRSGGKRLARSPGTVWRGSL